MNCVTCGATLVPVDIKEGVAYLGTQWESTCKIITFGCPDDCAVVTGFENNA